MLESKEWRGLWWDARDPERSIAGVLTFSQDDTELQLLGRLPPFGSGASLAPWFSVERPRISGITTEGKHITLHRCIPRGSKVGGGIAVERHHADVVLVGATYPADEEILFNELSVRFTHLDRWATVSGFNSSLEWKDDSVTSVNIKYQPPDPVVVTLPSGLRISLTFSWSWSGQEQVTTQAHVEQRAELIVGFPQPTALTDALRLGGQLRNFLNLGVGKPVHPVRVVGIVASESVVDDDPASGESDRRERIRTEVLYHLSDRPSPEDLDKPVFPHEMLFTLDSVHDSLGERLEAWFDNYERLRPAFDLYFGVVYGATRYLEPRFLALAQALETYHGRSSLADPHRGQRPFLRTRLLDILDVCPTVSGRLIGDTATFVDRTVRGRNYYTHYDVRLQSRVVQGIELLPVTAQLSALLEMCLLCEVGFGDTEVDDIFERVGRYANIEHLQRVVAEDSGDDD